MERSAKTKPPSLLVVDDVPAIHEMIKGLVEPKGYACEGALDGNSALQALEKHDFDIILVDFTMVPMDGLTLIQKMVEAGTQAKLVLMTGYVEEELEIRALESGASCVLEKPFQFERVYELLLQNEYGKSATKA